MNIQKFTILFLILYNLLIINGFSQQTSQINPELLEKPWQAKWISHPQITGNEYGVYLFRKTFELNADYQSFIIHITADNRYKLYINEQYVNSGSSRGDLLKWRFESLDIAKYLKKGKNVISIIVWNFAHLRPVAQFSQQTGLIVQGNTAQENLVNTNQSWLVWQDAAYSPWIVNLNQYYVVGPGEKFDAQNHLWDWQKLDYQTNNWLSAKEIEVGTPIKSMKEYGSLPRYALFPRDIPLMEEKLQRFAQIRQSDLSNLPKDFVSGKQNLTIPAKSKVKILFDQGVLTNAYPVLVFSQGLKSEIKLTYAEGLFDEKMEKGNRNEITNKKIIGNQDIIISDGGNQRTFQTLWWRTFRYVELQIETKDNPLIINDFHSIFTGYPLQEKASFKCNNPQLSEIWQVGWRTQRLCAGETFFDCPYYEQLQYAGDTRIQNLVTSYVSGDTTLMRNSLIAYNDSRLALGLTQSRYPSYQTQIIPTFSLIWITMVYDYWMQCDDNQLVKSMLPGMMEILQWYEKRMDKNGMLGKMEWWNFTDWVNFKDWKSGIPPMGETNNSAIINLQYAYTLQKTSLIFKTFGIKEKAEYYENLANQVKSAVFATCYDSNKGLMADTPEKNNFSQHANIMAILSDAIPQNSQKDILLKILNNKEIAQASYYYQFYLIQALEKVSLSEQYTTLLSPWEEMLTKGLTTFAEEPEPTRSDCHAWSASPVYYFLSLICGIKPNETGFKSVKIAPNLGNLTWIEGAMPHRLGIIKVSLKKDKGQLKGEITLPQGLNGIFNWQEKTIVLKSGINKI